MRRNPPICPNSPFILSLTPGSSFFSPARCVNPRLVLGLPHPAVATRDVALYRPFRNTLRSPNHVTGLQTLMWHFMNRQVQKDHVVPVSYILPSNHSRIRSVGTDSPSYSWRTPVLSLTSTDPWKPIVKRQLRQGTGRSFFPLRILPAAICNSVLFRPAYSSPPSGFLHLLSRYFGSRLIIIGRG